ncbi:MAG: hypothetical protein ABIF88_01185 [archaeon]
MERQFYYHFTQNGNQRTKTFGADLFGNLSARERLENILKNSLLVGGNQKGHKYHQGSTPESISFTGRNFERLKPFFDKRSHYAVAFLGNRIEKHLTQVRYLTDEERRKQQIPQEEEWAVDIVRPEFSHDLEGNHKKRYDFRWEEEQRIKGKSFKFKKNPDFIIVPTQEEVRIFNGEFGVEALSVEEDYKRVEEFRSWNEGKLPPFEKVFGDIYVEAVNNGEKTRPGTGKLILQEMSWKAWEFIVEHPELAYEDFNLIP